MTRDTTPRPALVVLAAGMGSRYGSLKQLDAVGPGGATLLDYSVYDAMRSGFGTVVFVIRPDMEAAFAPFAAGRYGGVTVRTVHQAVDTGRTRPWGTAQAVLVAEPAVAGPLAVVNADDFYGRAAFEAAREFFGAGAGATPSWAVVGFRLDQTVPASGGVNRAVCRFADGWLTSIEEILEIVPSPDGGFTGRGEAGPAPLRGDELVSMNMWAFTPEVFGVLRRGFAEFRRSAAPPAEYLLPAAVDAALRAGEARVRVLDARSRWFGMTHAADRDGVARELAALVRAGAYPERPW